MSAMRAKGGQVAIYLLVVLVALVIMVLVDLNAFFAVRAKNQMMNAVDGAALEAARYQGYLLNRIGEINVRRLRMAVLGERWDEDEEKLDPRHQISLFGPLKALVRANEAARGWGRDYGALSDVLARFREHIAEIKGQPDLYLEGGEGQGGSWSDYANELERTLNECTAVVPSYMEMANPGTSGSLFANWTFYNVIAAKAWCWFSIGDRIKYLDQDPYQPVSVEFQPVEPPENSEVFSLHVTYKTWEESEWGNEFDAEWTNFVCLVTGLQPSDFSSKSFVTDDSELKWAFYDDRWGRWSSTFNADAFPIDGEVVPAYDVAGCFTSLMHIGEIPQMKISRDSTDAGDDDFKTINRLVTAEAKPFGTVRDESGSEAPVTAYRNFIAAPYGQAKIFDKAHLVLVGSVPRAAGVSMESAWYDHVKKHQPNALCPGCRYCDLWREFANSRTAIRLWLNANSESCRPKGGSGPVQKGGYQYAH